jgi:putative membrane protein
VIKSFNDYAANERTFLAWVRTAIALMAFGFLLERLISFSRWPPSPWATRRPTSPMRASAAVRGWASDRGRRSPWSPPSAS